MTRNKKYRCGHWQVGEWTENGDCPSCVEGQRRKRKLAEDAQAVYGYQMDLGGPVIDPGTKGQVADGGSAPDSTGDSTQ